MAVDYKLPLEPYVEPKLTKLSSVLWLREYPPRKDGKPGQRHYEHFCPGCGYQHAIAVGMPFDNGAAWTFDGNAEQPTFHPSINCGPGTTSQCHYFLHAGKLKFLGDCAHALKGQTVDLPPIPQNEE